MTRQNRGLALSTVLLCVDELDSQCEHICWNAILRYKMAMEYENKNVIALKIILCHEQNNFNIGGSN